MWFKLATADFKDKNLGKMADIAGSWGVTYTLQGNISKDNCPTTVKMNDGKTQAAADFTATFTLGEGATLTSITAKLKSSGTQLIQVTSGTSITIPAVSITGDIEIIAIATSSSTGGGGTPVTPTNYTFTITPDPDNATVTLSATGYSTVSGTGSQSITVANGTTVNWSVSADNYITRTGNWTADGEDKTENITLSEAPAGNLMDARARLDANTEFASETTSTTQWGPFRGAVPVVENDYVKISCENVTQSLAGIRMGVPASVSKLPAGTKVKVTFSYRHDASYTPAGEYKFYTSTTATSFSYTADWQQFSKTYTWNNDWDRMQISSATTLQKEAIFYVKDFCIEVVNQ